VTACSTLCSLRFITACSPLCSTVVVGLWFGLVFFVSGYWGTSSHYRCYGPNLRLILVFVTCPAVVRCVRAMCATVPTISAHSRPTSLWLGKCIAVAALWHTRKAFFEEGVGCLFRNAGRTTRSYKLRRTQAMLGADALASKHP